MRPNFIFNVRPQKNKKQTKQNSNYQVAFLDLFNNTFFSLPNNTLPFFNLYTIVVIFSFKMLHCFLLVL